jgi:hypothetical protein
LDSSGERRRCEFSRREDPRRTRGRHQRDESIRRGTELADRGCQVAAENAVAADLKTLGGHSCGGDEHQRHERHREMLLTCWYISSAARTTFEFASYARWLTIMLMNSSTTLTFDCSM